MFEPPEWLSVTVPKARIRSVGKPAPDGLHHTGWQWSPVVLAKAPPQPQDALPVGGVAVAPERITTIIFCKTQYHNLLKLQILGSTSRDKKSAATSPRASSSNLSKITRGAEQVLDCVNSSHKFKWHVWTLYYVANWTAVVYTPCTRK